MDHDPDTRPDLVALTAHAAGWTVLLATVLVVRTPVAGASRWTAVLVVGGLAVFSGLVAWSGVRIVMQHLGVERRAIVERQCGLGTPHLVVVPRRQRTSAVGGSWGRTTIVARPNTNDGSHTAAA